MASVLIVDDDPFIRKLVSTTLEDVAGFEPAEAPGGEQALDLARAEPPALVFLDIDMPGIDGYEVCRRLRAEPETAQTTIVMLTAAACKEVERELGREPEGVRHGPRPIDVDVLLLGDLRRRSPRLTLPHPEIARRRFVL